MRRSAPFHSSVRGRVSDGVDDSVAAGLLGRQEVVSLDVALDSLRGLTSVLCVDPDDRGSLPYQFASVDFEVSCLPLQPAGPWLVHQNLRVRQSQTLPRGAGR